MSKALVTETLPNGLKIILQEIHNAPLISLWIWYRFGSRDELPGQTGSAHWIEHMQFKGTPAFSGEMLDRRISREGGVWNAFTFLDWTTYFVTLPADKIELALRLESDRMVNSLFDEDEFLSERTVILAEMDGSRNDPYLRLKEKVQAEAFRRHPYGHPVIGWREDLQSMTRDTLYSIYRQRYVPANAVLSVAGDFSSQDMLKQIKHYFADLPVQPAPRRSVEPEPPQEEERRVVLSGKDETPLLQIAYRAPSIQHPDVYALHVLQGFLAGVSGLGIMGGALSNKTSYLYRQLINPETLVAVQGSFIPTMDPFLQTFFLVLPPGGHYEQALQRFDRALDAVLQKGVREDDLQRTLKQLRALWAYGNETVTQHASALGYYEMLGDWNLSEVYLQRLQMVTREDLLRVARRWLVPQNRVVGVYQSEQR